MSLLYKRTGSRFWYVSQTRESTGTINRKDAEEFARKSLAASWRTNKLGEHSSTFADLARSWLDEKADKSSLDSDARVIRDFTAFLTKRKMATEPLSDLTAITLREYAKQIRLRASASTANNHMRILRAMLNHGVAEGLLAVRPPVKMFEVLIPERAALTQEQIAAIGDNLPDWARDMFVFAGQTGLRWGNVCRLRWEWITQDGAVAVVPAVQAKTRRTYTAPLSQAAKEVLQRRKQALEGTPAPPGASADTGLVFWSPSRPFHRVPSLKSQWARACKRAAVTDVCWHVATRHTWASHHTMNGTPDRVIQEMAGWASGAMLQKYVHLKVEHLISYADNVNARAPE